MFIFYHDYHCFSYHLLWCRYDFSMPSFEIIVFLQPLLSYKYAIFLVLISAIIGAVRGTKRPLWYVAPHLKEEPQVKHCQGAPHLSLTKPAPHPVIYWAPDSGLFCDSANPRVWMWEHPTSPRSGCQCPRATPPVHMVCCDLPTKGASNARDEGRTRWPWNRHLSFLPLKCKAKCVKWKFSGVVFFVRMDSFENTCENFVRL